MISEPKNVLILGDNGITVYLECSASSRPQSKYSWKRQGQDAVITSSVRYVMIVTTRPFPSLFSISLKPPRCPDCQIK